MAPLPGPPAALLLDAAGTLLDPREPIAATYAQFAGPYGCRRSVAEIGAAFGPAMAAARPLRQGSRDWRRYWVEVVAQTTGVHDGALVDALVDHFTHAEAWTVAPGARRCLAGLRAAGTKLALVSNWSARLRPLLAELDLSGSFDAILISAEEGIEKPDPAIFERACARLGVACDTAVHVGDRHDADVLGARAAGCRALHFGPGREIPDFDALSRALGGC